MAFAGIHKIISTECSTPVVFTLGVGKNRVRLPALRNYNSQEGMTAVRFCLARKLPINFMKIIFQNTKQDVLFLMRRAGYGYEGKDVKTGPPRVGEPSRVEAGELNFSRRLGANRYPRFHVYAKKDGDTMIVNLHIDQKQPSYEGATAHSGEYEGELVEQEAEMIKLAVARAIEDK